jgi:hypothetical protein
MEDTRSRSLMCRFSRDMAELYTDLLGLGEAVDSGALFASAQRLVETATICVNDQADRTTIELAAQTAEILATTVLIRLRQLDDRGLILRPGRRRRLYGLSLSMLRTVRRAGAACTSTPTVSPAPNRLHNPRPVHYIENRRTADGEPQIPFHLRVSQ